MKRFVYLFSGIVFIFIFMLPYFILGENAYITTHDFLDSTVGHLEDILKNGVFFDLDAKLPLMYGVDRMSVVYTSPFDIKSLFFLLFSPYWAIIANMILVKIVAFIGMFFLLDEYIIDNNRILAFIVSFLFCIIPFYVDYGISSAGIPMLGYALLNIYNKKNVRTSFVLVAFYGLYSSIGLSGLFVCFLLFLFLIYNFYKERTINKLILLSLIILSLVYVFSNWGVIYDFFLNKDFVSHRKSWVNEYSIGDILWGQLNQIKVSQYHTGEYFSAPILIIVFFVWIIWGRNNKVFNKALLFFFLLVSLSLFGDLARLLPLKFFTSFQLSRFYFLYPAVILILFSIACAILMNKKKNYVIIVILVGLGSVTILNKEYKTNVKKLFMRDTNLPSFKQFFDAELFGLISKDLNINQDYSVRTCAVGFHPAVLEYNGFWTLDGYLNSYSLDYKNHFRKVIEKELIKDKVVQNYFDNSGGNRCYVFSAEIGNKVEDYIKHNSINIELNTSNLKELGCQYVFSTVKIDNYNDNGMSFVNSYTTNNSYYTIFVYKL